MMDCSDLMRNLKPGGVYLQGDSGTGVTYPPLKFNPMTGHSFDGVERIQKASDYRGVTWSYNPWTGMRRSLDDVDNDPNGSRIQPPSEYMFPTDGAHFATGMSVAVDLAQEGAERTVTVAPPEEEELFSNYKPSLEVQVGGNHYKDMKIQPVEFIHANGIGYIEGCVIKYVSRWRKKGGAEDLKKARHFIDLLLQLENAK